jgi:hypothetical protein
VDQAHAAAKITACLVKDAEAECKATCTIYVPAGCHLTLVPYQQKKYGNPVTLTFGLLEVKQGRRRKRLVKK